MQRSLDSDPMKKRAPHEEGRAESFIEGSTNALAPHLTQSAAHTNPAGKPPFEAMGTNRPVARW